MGAGSSESLYTSWDQEQRKRWEKVTSFGYEHFLLLVAEARGMSKKRVQALTQGQVWTGEEAKALGLVDNLGHFSDAL